MVVGCMLEGTVSDIGTGAYCMDAKTVTFHQVLGTLINSFGFSKQKKKVTFVRSLSNFYVPISVFILFIYLFIFPV